MEIKPEQYFWLRDGNSIKSIEELPQSLENMPQDIFAHHVNESKNDFANWVKEVFSDQELAEMILAAKNSIEMKHKVTAFLSNKQKKQEQLDMPKLLPYNPLPKKETQISKAKIRIKQIHKAVKKRVAEKVRKIRIKHLHKKRNKNVLSKKEIEKGKETDEKLSFSKQSFPEIKKEVELKSEKVACSLKCPHHSFEGAVAEFILGIAVGITIAAALSVYL